MYPCIQEFGRGQPRKPETQEIFLSRSMASAESSSRKYGTSCPERVGRETGAPFIRWQPVPSAGAKHFLRQEHEPCVSVRRSGFGQGSTFLSSAYSRPFPPKRSLRSPSRQPVGGQLQRPDLLRHSAYPDAQPSPYQYPAPGDAGIKEFAAAPKAQMRAPLPLSGLSDHMGQLLFARSAYCLQAAGSKAGRRQAPARKPFRPHSPIQG